MLDAAAPVQPPKWTKENPPVVVTVNRHRAAKERPDRRAKMRSSSMAQLVLYLPYISPTSPPYLPCISPMFPRDLPYIRRAKMRNSIMAQLVQQLAHLDRLKLVRRDRAFKVKLYLAYISPISRLYLAYISPISPRWAAWSRPSSSTSACSGCPPSQEHP